MDTYDYLFTFNWIFAIFEIETKHIIKILMMNAMLKTIFVFTLTAIIFMSCKTDQIEKKDEMLKTPLTEIRQTDEGYQFYYKGEPFYIKGAGLGNGDIEELAKTGANALRTWSTDNGKEILDEAHKNGLKVMMGIWVGLERHGFDYNDEEAVKQQFERIKASVMELKDHPALLLWGVGNEINQESTNPKVWDAVNDISKMIHEVDPNHLTTTSLAGMDKKSIDLISERAPDLDFISVQLYAGIEVLPRLVKESGYKGPVLVTEWGATGYWEVAKTAWGAPIENNSSVKADFYMSRYKKSIETQKQIMGSFVFLWGQKQERTPTWFGMFMPDGNATEPVDVMHYIWKGEWPENRSPRLNDFSLNGKKAIDNIKLNSGQRFEASVDVTDPDGDNLEYIWEIMEESTTNNTGGDREYVPESLVDLLLSNDGTSASFKAPQKKGAYRLYIVVNDGQKHSAHANIP
jgi:hypothetical protein